MFLKLSQNSQKKVHAGVSFLIELQETISKKETSQVLSCEFCEIFQKTLFTEHLRATASNIGFQDELKLFIVNVLLKVWEDDVL